MNIQITGKDFELTESLENFVNEKVNKLSKYDSRINKVSVVLSADDGHHKRGDIYSAEVIIDRAGKDVIVKENQDEMHAAIDTAVEKAKYALEKDKSKQTKKLTERYKNVIRGIFKNNQKGE
jgi:putative sigma-54 modulation protein